MVDCERGVAGAPDLLRSLRAGPPPATAPQKTRMSAEVGQHQPYYLIIACHPCNKHHYLRFTFPFVYHLSSLICRCCFGIRYGIAAALRERDSVERRIAAEEHLRKVIDHNPLYGFPIYQP